MGLNFLGAGKYFVTELVSVVMFSSDFGEGGSVPKSYAGMVDPDASDTAPKTQSLG